MHENSLEAFKCCVTSMPFYRLLCVTQGVLLRIFDILINITLAKVQLLSKVNNTGYV
jgi:hypothetical protein